ncbi:MAG TPA: hypothetical protein VM510_07825 [Caulifigura sp.]|nr:hypothetical protein [Caulifigura sp.]
MRSNRVPNCADLVRGGHEKLEQATLDLRAWWYLSRGAMTPPYEELSQRIIDLREQLRAHFHDEESADHTLGLDDLPQPANERTILLADLDQMAARLRACHPGMDCWTDADRALERFLKKLESHETGELATLPDVEI